MCYRWHRDILNRGLHLKKICNKRIKTSDEGINFWRKLQKFSLARKHIVCCIHKYIHTYIHAHILYWLVHAGLFRVSVTLQVKSAWRPQLELKRPVGYLLSAAEGLYSGQPKTNRVSSRAEDLSPRPPDYKSSALSTQTRRPNREFQLLGNGILSLLFF